MELLWLFIQSISLRLRYIILVIYYLTFETWLGNKREKMQIFFRNVANDQTVLSFIYERQQTWNWSGLISKCLPSIYMEAFTKKSFLLSWSGANVRAKMQWWRRGTPLKRSDILAKEESAEMHFILSACFNYNVRMELLWLFIQSILLWLRNITLVKKHLKRNEPADQTQHIKGGASSLSNHSLLSSVRVLSICRL